MNCETNSETRVSVFRHGSATAGLTDVLLLLVNVTDLEPDVDFRQRARRVVQNVAETLQTSRRDECVRRDIGIGKQDSPDSHRGSVAIFSAACK